jgi:hypothetical protein
VDDNREKWGDFWEKLMVINGHIVLRPFWSYPDKLYHTILYRLYLPRAGFELRTLLGIGTDCTGSYKSNYHAITTTTARVQDWNLLPQSQIYIIWNVPV